MIGAILTHLWQSTLFAAAAALLTLVFRKNRAKVRFALWLGASIKFFIPFALLINLGSNIRWTPAAHEIAARYATPALSFAVESVAAPFTPPAPKGVDWPLAAALALWACGFLAIAAIRFRLWRRVRAAVRASAILEIPAPVEIRSAPGVLEPGVVGLLRPVLLLPQGIVERLTPSEFEALLAHEICHVRRRDNLFAAIHMIAEAAFWFHPLVWWIGARMVEERERACDEEVLNRGSQPRVYADAILSVCRLYAESPLACVSGVTGSNIRRRIEAIMTNRRSETLNRAKKTLLAAAGFAAVAGPIVAGIVIAIGHLPLIHAQPPSVAVPQLRPPAGIAQPAPAVNQEHRLIAMLFDFSTMTPDEQDRARQAGIAYLNQLKPADRASVMLSGNGSVQVRQDFTSNPALLSAAIQQLNGPPASNPAPGSPARLDNIESATKILSALPDKKLLVYFSSGMTRPGEAAGDPAALQLAVNNAVRANVAIFPIDIVALAAPATFNPRAGSLTPPPGVSPEEFARRTAYAQAHFPANSAMARSYLRYGAPDQTEDRGSTQVWRYNYLDDFHGGAAFEFTNNGSPGARILYPSPAMTYQGAAEADPGFASLIRALTGGDAQDLKLGFPSRHASLRIYPVMPGMPASPDNRAAEISIPLDTLSGAVDILAQVRARTETGAAGKVAANLRDTSQAGAGTYEAAFNLHPGPYTCLILAREAVTGSMFGEKIDFDVK